MDQCFVDSEFQITKVEIGTTTFKMSNFNGLNLNVENQDNVEIVVRKCNVTYEITETLTNLSMGSTYVNKIKEKKFCIVSLDKDQIYVIGYQDTENEEKLEIHAITSNVTSRTSS